MKKIILISSLLISMASFAGVKDLPDNVLKEERIIIGIKIHI